MTKEISLLEMAKLTSGQTMMRKDDLAVSMDNKYFVRSFGENGDAYYPVIFEKDIVHRIKMLLYRADTTSERALLSYLAYDLGFEDEIKTKSDT
jgi:hypothetical protein